VLTDSLITNRIDGSEQIRLTQQRQLGLLDKLLQEAENAIRNVDWSGAMDIYRGAIAIDPSNPLLRMKLGLLCRDHGMWAEALEQFSAVTAATPGYGEAYREKGVLENKIAQAEKRPLDAVPAPGEPALRRAIELNDKDFDAYASLGGVLKRAKRYAEALACYERSLAVSGGHLYPLLNALKLRVQVNGQLGLSATEQRALMRAEQLREAQTKQYPPYDAPWSFFDLAEIKLYRGDPKAFLDVAMEGFEQTDANWQGQPFACLQRVARTKRGPRRTGTHVAVSDCDRGNLAADGQSARNYSACRSIRRIVRPEGAASPSQTCLTYSGVLSPQNWIVIG
jgi:tetratricopeptide (TPR) repeat protein